MKIFSVEGPFHKYGSMIFDVIILNFIWTVICGVSFGLLAGPASTALFSSVHQCILHQNGNSLQTFFEVFKSKFKVSLLGFMAFYLVVLSSILSLYLMSIEVMPIKFAFAYAALIVYMFMMMPYFIALVASSDLRNIQLVKYVFTLSMRHIVVSLLILVVWIVAMGSVVLIAPILVFMLPAPVIALNAYLLFTKVFIKYEVTHCR